MSRKAKQFALIVAAQTACLGVGLWMHHHYEFSYTARVVAEEAWSEIDSYARSIAPDLEGMHLTDVRAGGAALLPCMGTPEASRFGPPDVTVVDRQWRIVSACSAAEPAVARAAPPGSVAHWTPLVNPSAAPTDFHPGKLLLPDGEHIGVAYALENGEGQVLIHYPVSRLEACLTPLLSSTPMIDVTTFFWMSALLSVAVYLILARFHDDMERERSRSVADTLRQTQNLVRTRDAVIFGLAKLAESRDPDTGNHLERISVYSTTLAAALRRDPKFRDEVTPTFARLIGISCALHDIGKVGVEDRILRKPGPLTEEEHAAMRMHAAIGGTCLQEIEQRLGGSNFLQMAREIAFAHHEHWDGTGYPKGLKGRAIPLAARIVAIADVYDALSSQRVYKPALPHEECVATIRDEAGRKFDPDLVEAWLKIESKFRSIAQRFVSRSETSCGQDALPPEVNGYAEEAGDDLCVAPSGAGSETS